MSHSRTQDRFRLFFVLLFMCTQWVTTFLIFDNFYIQEDTAPQDYFIPTEATFSVWGVIYLGSTAYAIYQALPKQQARTLHRRVGWWLGANFALCSLWNIVSLQSGNYGSPNFRPEFIVLTVVIIVLMLLTMTRAFVILRQLHGDLTKSDRWLVQAPHAVYFAWLNVAVIANTTSVFIAYGLTGEPYGAYWSAGMIVIAIILTSLMVLYSHPSLGTVVYTATIVWTYIGVFIDNNNESSLVGGLAVLGILVIVCVTVFHFVQRGGGQNRFRRAISVT